MAKIIFDDITEKDKIGKAISASKNHGCETAIIVSPYLSDIELLRNVCNISSLRIICNAKSNSCNPYILQHLLSKNNVQVKWRSDIHAKVYSFGNCVYVTSANATPNGLGTGTIEAGIELDDVDSLTKIEGWFNSLWNNEGTRSINEFTREEWLTLEANWNINSKNTSKKTHLIDLLRTKTIADDIAFCFWTEIRDAPSKKKVLKEAETQSTIELPKAIDAWDYWVEGIEETGNYSALEGVLKRFYGSTLINIKVNDWPFDKLYKRKAFPSKTLDKPILHKYRGKKLLLSLYRTDCVNLPFKVDSEAIDLINRSIRKNEIKWRGFFKSTSGKYGYCTTKNLYKLIAGCI